METAPGGAPLNIWFRLTKITQETMPVLFHARQFLSVTNILKNSGHIAGSDSVAVYHCAWMSPNNISSLFNNHTQVLFIYFLLHYTASFCSSIQSYVTPVTECKYFIWRSPFLEEQTTSCSAAAQNTLLIYRFETPPMLPPSDIIPFKVVHISEHFIKSLSAYYFAC